MYMFEYLMYIFEDQMCIFGHLKIPDIILSLVSSQKLDWTQTFGTYCIPKIVKCKMNITKRLPTTQATRILQSDPEPFPEEFPE